MSHTMYIYNITCSSFTTSLPYTTFIELSQEKLGLADGDYILTSTYGAADDTERSDITGSGLWTGLAAVEDGRTAQVDDDLITGIGIQAANGFLDVLAEVAQR